MSGDHLFVGFCTGTFRSFDRKSGRLEWAYDAKKELGENSLHAALFLGQDVVVGATENPSGSVYEFAPCDTCRILWRRPCGQGVRSDLLGAGDRVFVHTNQDSVLCLDRASGRTLWTYAAPDTSGPPRNKQLSPALAGDLILCIDNRSTLRALRTGDGTVAWERCFDEPIMTSVSVWRGVAYVGTRDRVFHGVDPATGAVKSRLAVPGVDWPPLTCSERGLLGWASHTDTVAGKVNWHWQLVAYDREMRRVLWTKSAPGQVLVEGQGDEWNTFRPLVLGKLAVVGTFRGHVLAYDLESGEVVWQMQIEGPVRAIAEDPDEPGHIYIGTGSGSVYAFDAANAAEPGHR